MLQNIYKLDGVKGWQYPGMGSPFLHNPEQTNSESDAGLEQITKAIEENREFDGL